MVWEWCVPMHKIYVHLHQNESQVAAPTNNETGCPCCKPRRFVYMCTYDRALIGSIHTSSNSNHYDSSELVSRYRITCSCCRSLCIVRTELAGPGLGPTGNSPERRCDMRLMHAGGLKSWDGQGGQASKGAMGKVHRKRAEAEGQGRAQAGTQG